MYFHSPDSELSGHTVAFTPGVYLFVVWVQSVSDFSVASRYVKQTQGGEVPSESIVSKEK